jgi:serine/threonine protein kinase
MIGMLNAKPARLLLGRELPNGWRVVERVARPTNATGGNFGAPYIVEREGKSAFLKAMDLSRALLTKDLLTGLQHFAEAIRFEGSLLEVCAEKGMTRVVRLLDQGTVELDDANTDPLARRASTAFYFIFELATGDLRASIEMDQSASAKIGVLHDVALAIQQLHIEGIAHQDIKPSNVVSFTEHQKLADLGRASRRGSVSPNDHWAFPGDPTYMPPEYAYGHVPPEYRDRRLGADFYALGSLLAFLFTLESATPLLLESLPAHVQPTAWKGGGFDDALPYLVDAHAQVCHYVEGQLPEATRIHLLEAFRQLTHPDPSTRGHPNARRQTGKPLGIERYVSLFDLLKRRQAVADRMQAKALK